MPSESEVREAVETVKHNIECKGTDDQCLDCRAKKVLVELSEAWLGRKMPEKKEIESFSQQKADGSFECSANQQYVNGWNSAIDACRLASVVSEEEIEKIINQWEDHHDNTRPRLILAQYIPEIAHAIAEYVNGGGK